MCVRASVRSSVRATRGIAMERGRSRMPEGESLPRKRRELSLVSECRS